MPEHAISSDQQPISQVLTEETWFHHGQALIKETYLQPIHRTSNGFSIPPSLKSKVNNGYLEREIHGAMHASRVAWSTTLIHQLCVGNFPGQVHKHVEKLCEYCQLKPNQILILIRLVGLGHDAARKGEGYDRWEKESADVITRFLVTLGLSESHATVFGQLAYLKDNPEDLKQFLSDKKLEQSLIDALDYARLLVSLADCYDIIRCTGSFQFAYIENKLKGVFNEYNSKDHSAVFYGYAKALYELLKQQQDLYFPTKLMGPNDDKYKLDVGKADYSVAAKVKLEHADNAIIAMQKSMKAHPYFADLLSDLPTPDMKTNSIEPAFVPFIHGTNSMTLALMTETDFKIMSPIEMMTDYQRAPLCGELTKGGFSSARARGNPCFGRLNNHDKSNEYSLEKVLNKYAVVSNKITKEQALADLNNACEMGPKIHFANINLINIYLTRLSQLDVDLSKIEAVRQLKISFQKSMDIFYLYQLLGMHLKINHRFDEMTRLERIAVGNKVIQQLKLEVILSKLPMAGGLTIKDVSENPTPENCQKVIELLSLPKNQFDLPLIEYVKTPSAGITNNRSRRKDFYHFARNSSSWEFTNIITSLVEGKYQMGDFTEKLPKIKSYLKQLNDRFAYTESLIDHPNGPLHLSQADADLIKKPFPVIFLYNKAENIRILSFITQEYRAEKPLKLGQDIRFIATDSRHKKQVQDYVQQHELNMTVLTFEQLKAIKNSYLKENPCKASNLHKYSDSNHGNNRFTLFSNHGIEHTLSTIAASVSAAGVVATAILCGVNIISFPIAIMLITSLILVMAAATYHSFCSQTPDFKTAQA